MFIILHTSWSVAFVKNVTLLTFVLGHDKKHVAANCARRPTAPTIKQGGDAKTQRPKTTFAKSVFRFMEKIIGRTGGPVTLNTLIKIGRPHKSEDFVFAT